MSAEDVMSLRTVADAALSPDGRQAAFTVSVARRPDDEAGPGYSELYLVDIATGTVRPFITGKVNVSSPEWSPDGAFVAFISRRGQAAVSQVWAIPAGGGEAAALTQSETDVAAFHWHPRGGRLAYVAAEPAGVREKELQKRGYGFITFEENLKPRRLYLQETAWGRPPEKPRALTTAVSVWDFVFSPDGGRIAFAGSERNLVDEEYMFKKIYLLDPAGTGQRLLYDPQRKLGNLAFSPDGARLAFVAARETRDHAVSQAYWMALADGRPVNVTPAGFRGHVSWVGWKDARTLIYLAHESVWTSLNLQPLAAAGRETLLHSRGCGLVFSAPLLSRDGRCFLFPAQSPAVPGDLFAWQPGSKAVRRLTHLNPWLQERRLGRQEAWTHAARDGQPLEGVLVYPVDYQPGRRYPLVVSVHGGPESVVSDGWHTGYLNPAQVLAGRGYLVFHPNYRASTGYGVEFALAGYGDPAGREFDDIADAIGALAAEGLADPERVGVGGGSYGGYAAAWFATRYTKLARAAVMFVGISDVISKRGTTDIPWEEHLVHSGKRLEEMWELELQRSPIYWAHQSRTAVLIVGGTADTRVDPTQSRELFRIMKMNGHPAVRLVQYPGEGHGNRRQTSRIDLLHRHLDWYDWYLKEAKPLSGPMPPLDISDRYGLPLPKE